MEADVDAFVVLYVDWNLLDEMQRLSIGGFHAFEIGFDDVVGLAGGNALGEFSRVVGKSLPLRFFIRDATNLDFDSVDGVIVGSPDGAEDKSVGVGSLQLFVWERGVAYGQQGWTQ
jgi:hypothetical protein